MKHQLNPGSYELVQEGSVRGDGYVIEESPGVTVQRWLFLPSYVRAPTLSATFRPRSTSWPSFEQWSNFVGERWQSGYKYAIARCTQYAHIDDYRDSNQQLDGNAAIAKIGLQTNADPTANIFTIKGREGSSHMFEHWVLRDDYDATAREGIGIELPAAGLPGLNEFRSLWRAQWKTTYTYVVVDCRYYDTLPANL